MKPREWWLVPDDKVLYSNRKHFVLDDEQARDFQSEYDGDFGPPKRAIRIIEKSAYDAILAERDRYAQAMAVALHEGIFANKQSVKEQIELILKDLK